MGKSVRGTTNNDPWLSAISDEIPATAATTATAATPNATKKAPAADPWLSAVADDIKKKVGTTDLSGGSTPPAPSPSPSPSPSGTPEIVPNAYNIATLNGVIQPEGTFKPKPSPVKDLIQQMKDKATRENGVLTVHDNSVVTSGKDLPDIKEAIDTAVQKKIKADRGVDLGTPPSKYEIESATKVVTDAYKRGDLVPAKSSDGKSVMKRGTGLVESIVNGIDEVYNANQESAYFKSLSKDEKIRHLNLKQQFPDVLNPETTTAPSGFSGKLGNFIGENANMLATTTAATMVAPAALPEAVALGSGNFASFLSLVNDTKNGYKNNYEKVYYDLKKQGLSDSEAADKAEVAGVKGQLTQLGENAVFSGLVHAPDLSASAPAVDGVIDGIVKSAGNLLKKEAPKMATVSAVSSLANSAAMRDAGVKVDPVQAMKDAVAAGGDGAILAASFWALHEPVRVPSYLRPQFENVAASLPVEAREEFLNKAVETGASTPEQKIAVSKKINEFGETKTAVADLPIPEDKKAAITGKLVQAKKIQAEIDSLTPYGASFNDRVQQLTAQKENIHADINKMYAADDVFAIERDSLTGETPVAKSEEENVSQPSAQNTETTNERPAAKAQEATTVFPAENTNSTDVNTTENQTGTTTGGIAAETPTATQESQALPSNESAAPQETPTEIKSTVDENKAKREDIEKRRQEELANVSSGPRIKLNDIDPNDIRDKGFRKFAARYDFRFSMQENVDRLRNLLKDAIAERTGPENIQEKQEVVDEVDKFIKSYGENGSADRAKGINAKYDAELENLNKNKVDESQIQNTEVVNRQADERANVNNEPVTSEKSVPSEAAVNQGEQSATTEVRTKNADMVREIVDESSRDSDSNPLTFEEKDKIHSAINDYEEGNVSGEDLQKVMLDNGINEKYLSKAVSEILSKQNSITSNTTENASSTSQVPEQKMLEQSSERKHSRTVPQRQSEAVNETNRGDSNLGSEGGKPKAKVSRTKASGNLRNLSSKIREEGLMRHWEKSKAEEGDYSIAEMAALQKKMGYQRATPDQIRDAFKNMDGKPPKEVLQYIQDNTTDPNLKMVAEALSKSVEEKLNFTKFEFDIVKDEQGYATSHNGVYRNGQITVYEKVFWTPTNLIHKNGLDGGFKTVLHEFVHAATLEAYRHPKTPADYDFKKYVDKVYKDLKSNSDASLKLYGFTSPTEFIAEVVTNPEFQQLATVYKPNLLTRISQLIAKILGKPLKTAAGEEARREIVLANSIETILSSLPDLSKGFGKRGRSSFEEGIPEENKKTGFGGKSLDEAVAKALDLVADAIDAGKGFSDSVNEGFAHVKDYYAKNTKSFDEKKLKDQFRNNIKKLLGTEEVSDQKPAEWTSVRKEKLKEIEGVKKEFEKRTSIGWNEVYDRALKKVQDSYPNKSLYDAVRSRVNEFVVRLNNKELFNPTSEDIAVFNVFRNQTQKRINEIEGMDSDNQVQRLAAVAEFEPLHEDLMNVARVTNPNGEAGRAFGMLQSEVKLDPDYGLKVRRMELIRSKGGEKLSAEDLKWTQEKWEQEKAIMKREQEVREKTMRSDFDAKLEQVRKEFEDKLKKPTTSAAIKERTLSQKGKDIADQIRKLKKPKGSLTVDFTLGTWDLAIEGIAKLVEGGATVAEAIEKIVKDGSVGFAKEKDRSDFEGLLTDWINNKKDKETSLEKIRSYAEENSATDITNEMVKKNLIKDYVEAHIGDYDKKDILDAATKDLKSVLPDINKNRVIEAYLRDGEFKQPTKRELEGSLAEAKKELRRVAKQMQDNSEDVVQAKKLEQVKKKITADIKRFERRIEEGDYEDKVPVRLKREDAELINLQKQRETIQGEYRKKQDDYKEKNKSRFERVGDFVRSAYVAALIGHPKTLLKVGALAVLRPASEATSKLTFGKVFDAFFPGISKAAKRGGESSSINSVKKGFEAYFNQMGKEKVEAKYLKAESEYNNALKEHQDYKATVSGVKSAYGENSPEYKATLKKLATLKDNVNSKLLKAQGDIIYQFIGGSSLKDALGSFVNRSNEIERQFGKINKESLKEAIVNNPDHSAIENIVSTKFNQLNYILGFIGRSHSALKTFSGRFSFASGFMSRLEAAVGDGRDISNVDTMLEIAHESYIDWERGKYQQSNFISDKWNKLINSLEKGETGKNLGYSKIAKYILQTDVAITRVPVNVLHEAVMEYTLGAFRAIYMATKEAAAVKKKLIEGGILPTKEMAAARRNLEKSGITPPDSVDFKAEMREAISEMDADRAAMIARSFRKGGIGAGLYALALISGAVKFGIFPHLGQKKKKEEGNLPEDELNPGQVQIGGMKLGEISSGTLDHIPALWPMFMGLGMAQSYHDQIQKGKTTAQAVGEAIKVHLQVVEGSIPQTKIVSPTAVLTSVTQNVTKRAKDMGIMSDPTKFTEEDLKSPAWQLLEQKGLKPPVMQSNNVKLPVKGNQPDRPLTPDEFAQFNQQRKDLVEKFVSSAWKNNQKFSGKVNGVTFTNVPIKEMTSDQLKSKLKTWEAKASKIAKSKMVTSK